MLPDTTGRFGLTQIFDWDGRVGSPQLSQSDIMTMGPHYDTVWGAFFPQYWLSANSNINIGRYTLPPEDNNTVSGHDLSYWQQIHPDWILYACDSNGNPYTNPRQLADSGTGFPDVPLAFYNPAVMQYQMDLLIPYLQSHGYKTLDADNTDLLNYLVGGNPNFPNQGQVYNTSNYGCGTFDANGNFVRRYGTQGQAYNRNDPVFIQDMIAWVTYAGQRLHAAGLKLVINHPLYNSPSNSNEQSLLSQVDGMLDENGYTHYGQLLTGSNFAGTLQWVEALQNTHKAAFVVDYFCSGSGCSTDPSTLTAQQVDWALASYAIGNEGGEDVYISPKTGAMRSYRNEYSTRYGAKCGSYSMIGSNVYMRKFQGALVVVNASGSPYSFNLPSGHSYSDIEGRPVSNPLNLGGADGYVLMTSNGCN